MGPASCPECRPRGVPLSRANCIVGNSLSGLSPACLNANCEYRACKLASTFTSACTDPKLFILVGYSVALGHEAPRQWKWFVSVRVVAVWA